MTRIPCSKINIPAITRNLNYQPKELRIDIEINGLLNPIIVKELSNGRYRLIDGFRRLMACLELNYDMIDVNIVPLNDPRYVGTNFESYTGVLQKLLDNMTIDELAQRLGKSVEWINYMINKELNHESQRPY
jgi:hypothetical protein